MPKSRKRVGKTLNTNHMPEILIIWGGPLDYLYGSPVCKRCKKSLVGEVIQHTLFKCPKCKKTFELHADCARQGCPDCGGILCNTKNGTEIS